MTYCEDYPCCGHTDGLGCDWTYTPEARAFDMAHAMCDHENGYCEIDLGGEEHAYDEDDLDDNGRPWCYGCDAYARCGDYENHDTSWTNGNPYAEDATMEFGLFGSET